MLGALWLTRCGCGVLTQAEAGHYIQVIAAYLASLEVIVAARGDHSSIIGT